MTAPSLPPSTPGRPTRRTSGVRALLALLVCAVAATFVLASAVLMRVRAAAARTAVEGHAMSSARIVAGRVDDHVRQVKSILAVASHTVRYTERGDTPAGSVAFNDSLLAAIKQDLRATHVSELSAYDARGTNIGTSYRPLPSRDAIRIADRPYFQEAVRTRAPVVGDPRRSAISGAWSVAVVHPIVGRDGGVVSVLAATLRAERLDEALAVSGLPVGSTITLLDRRGVILTRSPDARSWAGRQPPQRQEIDARLAAEGGVVEAAGFDSTRRLIAHAPVRATGWNVYVGIPTSVAFAAVSAEVRRDLGVGVLTLLVTLVLAMMIARRITRPVAALVADAEALAAGDFTRRAAVREQMAERLPHELATLAAAYDEMANTIARRTAELHGSEQRHRLLFDASPLPMYLADLSTYRILAVNDAALAVYGYTREEFLALTLLDIRPPEDRLRFLAVTRSLELAQLEPGRGNAGIWRHVRKDGTPFEVEMFTAITEFEGRPARLSIASDITARRRAERALQESEEQLRRSQKMEALGRFAGGIAHDFNNILTGILGYCDLALEDLPPDGTGREEFQEIRAAAQRAAGLTGRILAFSRGRVTQPRPVELGGVVAELQPMLRRLIGEHIQLDVRHADAGAAVLGDPGQLEQVLLNLALNARDAMPDGGTLAVSTRRVVVEPDDPTHRGITAGEYSLLEVRDTGVGMTAETQAHIFEPFFTTKERGKGTGLGLATVYGIVRQSGGAVRVESSPRRGSLFAVYLPRVDTAVDERRVVLPSAAPRHGTETILLVEDEDAVRAIARATLARQGYTVLVAPDGHSALEVARAHPGEIALLLTDVVMPGMSGRTLAERLSRERPDVAVVFMSGYTEDEVLHRGVSGETIAFISKPFMPDALAAKVREALDAAAGAGVTAVR